MKKDIDLPARAVSTDNELMFDLNEYVKNPVLFTQVSGNFSLMQLKVIQEVVSLIVFCVIANFLFQGQSLHWNHLAALVCLVLAVYFVFMNND